MAASAVVQAPPERTYEVFAVYREHDRILPRPPFREMRMEEGGVGAGTVIHLEMRVLGKTRATRGFVTEPEPGRLLVETYPDDGMVTSFTVDPGPRPGTSHVTIATDFTVRGGIAGAVERWAITRLLRPVYERELAQLDAYVREHPRAPAAHPPG
jgi:hypothetical protein